MRLRLLSLIMIFSPIFCFNHQLVMDLPLKFGPEDAFNLVDGLLKGLAFNDVDALMKCFNNIPDIYNDVLTIIDLLQHIDIKHFRELMEAIITMFDLVDEILHSVSPCANVQDSERIKEIINDIMNANIEHIALNLLIHGGKIALDLLSLPSDYNSSDFSLFGFHIGDIVTQIFLSTPDTFTPQDSYNLTNGILKGLKFTDIDILMKCFHDFPEIYNGILDIVALLQNIDIKHVQQLIKALAEIFELVSNILTSIDPCAHIEDSKRIHEIIQLLQQLDLDKVAANILMHGGRILADVLDLPVEFQKGNYYQFGFDMGDLVTQVLLT